jgi:hypothetical protein
MTTVAAGSKDGSTETSSRRPATTTLPEVLAPPAAVDREETAGKSAEQVQAPDSAGLADFEAATALPQVLKVVGSVVAPTTLLTALLGYFGLVYAIAFFRYFNVNYSVLNLPVQDYLVLSQDGLMVPLIFLAGVTLLALWLYQRERLIVKIPGIGPRVLVWVTSIAGAMLVGLAMADSVFGAPVFPAQFWEARGLSLSIGVLLLGYTARLRRVIATRQRAEQPQRHVPEAVIVAKWSAVFVLVSAGLFWAVGSYAVGVGEGHARDLEAALPYSPDVVLYSDKGLSMQGMETPGVHEVICHNPDPAYRFRYDGLKLVPQSGNQYLFLPAGWTRANGAAIVMPRSDKIRLEFGPSDQMLNATC